LRGGMPTRSLVVLHPFDVRSGSKRRFDRAQTTSGPPP
jgi:hypothetical protein